LKIKGKSISVLKKAYSRISKTNPVKAGHIKNYLKKHKEVSD
jgi:hypothetical protein